MVAEDLHIVIIQPRITWGNEQETLDHIDELLAEIPSCDLVILPEMFHTGFSTDKRDAVNMDDTLTPSVLQRMYDWSLSKNAAICGSVKAKVGNQYFNRFLLIQEGRITAEYDKRHLFHLMKEGDIFTAGKKKALFYLKGWRIQPFICYDLRFPAWCRNTEDVDLQVHVANWPAKRAHHWTLLLQTRAVENQCYVAGANTTGVDDLNNTYSGDSVIFAPDGKTICTLPKKSGWIETTLSLKGLKDYRKRYPFLKDRDNYIFEE